MINTAHVIRIIRERRKIALPEDLRDLYEQVFAAFTPAEFLNFWQGGSRQTLQDGILIHETKCKPG